MLYICLIIVLIRNKCVYHNKKHFQNIEDDLAKINDDNKFNYTLKNDPAEIFPLFDLPNL